MQKRRIQAVLKSLQPFVAAPGSSTQQPSAQQPSSEQLLQQQELVQDLQRQCHEQLDRWVDCCACVCVCERLEGAPLSSTKTALRMLCVHMQTAPTNASLVCTVLAGNVLLSDPLTIWRLPGTMGSCHTRYGSGSAVRWLEDRSLFAH